MSGAGGIPGPVKAGAIAGTPPIGADFLPVKRPAQPLADTNPASSKAQDLLPMKQASKDPKGGAAGDQLGSQESDSFYKMYNKEIKVNQDEIPIILAELTDAAYNFI